MRDAACVQADPDLLWRVEVCDVIDEVFLDVHGQVRLECFFVQDITVEHGAVRVPTHRGAFVSR
jgi:hypothetical protein